MGEPLYEAEQYVEQGRLVYYLKSPDADYWDQFWMEIISSRYFEEAEAGYLEGGHLEELFIRYLPRQGRILEAGCGYGRIVIALRARGYEVEGVDWASKTVEAVRAIYPDLPIRVGDVTRLDVPDGYYSGYISLGTVEHRREGPEPFLKEAYRVLEPGGVAFISVPYFNPLRQLKGRLGLYQRGPKPDYLEFWQYAFTEKELTNFLAAAGFEIIDKGGYSILLCLRAEVTLFRLMHRMVKWRGIGRRLKHRFPKRKYVETQSPMVGDTSEKSSNVLNKEFLAKAKYYWIRQFDCLGNMLVMVCRKPKVSSYRGK